MVFWFSARRTAGGTRPSSTKARRETLIGFALAVFRVTDIVEKTGSVSASSSRLAVVIFDGDAKPGERLLYPKALISMALRTSLPVSKQHAPFRLPDAPGNSALTRSPAVSDPCVGAVGRP